MPISAFQATSHISQSARLTRQSVTSQTPNLLASRADFRLQLEVAHKKDNEVSEISSVVSEEIGALFIKNFLDTYIPKESSSIFDQGLASEYWKSMFTDSIADALKNSNELKLKIA
ncbi:MAG: hypothetical protein WCC66_15385 [Rhizobiaceae bacterium]